MLTDSLEERSTGDRIKTWWHILTEPKGENKEDLTREYMTKAILLIMSVLMFLAFIMVVITWAVGLFDIYSVFLVLGVAAITGGAWWLAYKGYWQIGSYLPPLIFFLVGIERLVSSGLGTAGVLAFPLAILLMAMLSEKRFHWLLMVLSIAVFVATMQLREQGFLPPVVSPEPDPITWIVAASIILLLITASIDFFRGQLQLTLREVRAYSAELEDHKANLEQQVAERTAELEESMLEQERLSQQVVEAQREMIRELATPVIPVMDQVIIMPLIGSVDTMRAQDMMRAIMAGIKAHQAKIIILDITGVSIVDTGIVQYIDKIIQVARLKGAKVVVTGISNEVAESIVEMGIEWSHIDTYYDLQTGVQSVMKQGLELQKN